LGDFWLPYAGHVLSIDRHFKASSVDNGQPATTNTDMM
jgi:hypothetical protein